MREANYLAPAHSKRRQTMLGERALSQKEREALLAPVFKPALFETWLYHMDGLNHVYTHRMDARVVSDQSELVEYMRGLQASADDGWNVCLFIDGKPEVKIPATKGADPWLA